MRFQCGHCRDTASSPLQPVECTTFSFYSRVFIVLPRDLPMESGRVCNQCCRNIVSVVVVPHQYRRHRIVNGTRKKFRYSVVPRQCNYGCCPNHTTMLAPSRFIPCHHSSTFVACIAACASLYLVIAAAFSLDASSVTSSGSSTGQSNTNSCNDTMAFRCFNN